MPILSTNLCVSKKAAVFVLETDEQDTTEYLLPTEANRKHLLQAVKDLENKSCYIYINSI